MSAATAGKLFKSGKSAAADWLAENAQRPNSISAAVCRAIRLTDAVLQYEAVPNFPELLAAWERGFDSTMRAAAAPADANESASSIAMELHDDAADFLMLAVDISRGIETCLALAQASAGGGSADHDAVQPPVLDCDEAERLLRLAQVSARLLSADAERRLKQRTGGAI